MERYREPIIRGFVNAYFKKRLEPECFEEMEEIVKEGRHLTKISPQRWAITNTAFMPIIRSLQNVPAVYRDIISKAILEAVKELENNEKLSALWEEFEKEYKKDIERLRAKVKTRTLRAQDYLALLWHLRDKIRGEVEKTVWETIKRKVREALRQR